MPVTSIVPATDPRFYREIKWPHERTPSVGSSLQWDRIGSVETGRIFDSSGTFLGVEEGSVSGTSRITDMRNPGGRICGRLQNGAGAGSPLAGFFNFPWYFPVLEQPDEIAAEDVPDPSSLVFIFDAWWRFSSANPDHNGGLTGFFFPIRPGAISESGLPNGSDPRTLFCLCGLDDGSGVQTLGLRTFNDTGGAIDTVRPSSAPDPTEWNTASLTVIQTRPNQAAVLRDVKVGTETLVGEREFGTATLLSGTQMRTGYFQPYFIISCEANTAPNDFFFRWRARWGRFTADGVEVTL